MLASIVEYALEFFTNIFGKRSGLGKIDTAKSITESSNESEVIALESYFSDGEMLMSKNITEYVTSVFTSIRNSGSRFGDVDISKYRIEPHEDKEQMELELNLFGTLKFRKSFWLMTDIQVGVFEQTDSNRKFIFISNLLKSNSPQLMDRFSDEQIFSEEVNTVLFLLAVKHMDLQVRKDVTDNEIEEKIFIPLVDETVNLEGEVVRSVFDDFWVLSIDGNNVIHSLADEVIGYYIFSFLDDLIHLDLSRSIEKYRSLLKLEIEGIPKENVFLSLTSTHWKHSFLEVYRCIEFLFSVPYSLDLKNELGLSCSARQLAKQSSKILVWRRKESPAFRRLMTNVDVPYILNSGLEQLKCFNFLTNSKYQPPISADNMSRLYDKVTEQMYFIRNQLVHQLEMTDEIEVNDTDWPVLIDFLLAVSLKNYNFYQNELAS